ncbi:MAG TPA: hypothetical protein VFK94_00370 [Patescibacteria group bacterium]|nr:hypothetical protein [Patescibacteria group bacterium]
MPLMLYFFGLNPVEQGLNRKRSSKTQTRIPNFGQTVHRFTTGGGLRGNYS